MTGTDVLTEPTVDEEEGPRRITALRMLRWVAILAVGILAVLAIWQDPLYAIHR